MANTLLNRARAFFTDRQGNVAMTFALLSVPTMLITGFAIDYGAMNSAASRLQSAVDSAVLAAAGQSENRETIGIGIFNAAIGNLGQTGSAKIDITDNGKIITATASLAVETSVMKLAGVNQVTISRTAKANTGSPGSAGVSDNSCVLAGNAAGNVNSDTLTIDPASTVALSNCSLHSNASLSCEGVDTGASTISASGIASACTGSISGKDNIPDIYAGLAKNIETVCGAAAGGVVWATGGAIPSGGNAIEVARDGYREIHICGSLKLTGKLALNGDDAAPGLIVVLEPASDLVIVIENGGLVIDDSASITANQTTFIFAGGSGSPIVTMPETGDKAARFSVSAASSDKNPWRGIAIYQHPDLAGNVDMTWKAGANIMIDGAAYFPNASLTLTGTLTSGKLGCSKISVGRMSVAGTLTLSQSAENCEKLGLKQYSEPGTPTAQAYLTQ